MLNVCDFMRRYISILCVYAYLNSLLNFKNIKILHCARLSTFVMLGAAPAQYETISQDYNKCKAGKNKILTRYQRIAAQLQRFGLGKKYVAISQ